MENYSAATLNGMFPGRGFTEGNKTHLLQQMGLLSGGQVVTRRTRPDVKFQVETPDLPRTLDTKLVTVRKSHNRSKSGTVNLDEVPPDRQMSASPTVEEEMLGNADNDPYEGINSKELAEALFEVKEDPLSTISSFLTLVGTTQNGFVRTAFETKVKALGTPEILVGTDGKTEYNLDSEQIAISIHDYKDVEDLLEKTSVHLDKKVSYLLYQCELALQINRQLGKPVYPLKSIFAAFEKAHALVAPLDETVYPNFRSALVKLLSAIALDFGEGHAFYNKFVDQIKDGREFREIAGQKSDLDDLVKGLSVEDLLAWKSEIEGDDTSVQMPFPLATKYYIYGLKPVINRAADRQWLLKVNKKYESNGVFKEGAPHYLLAAMAPALCMEKRDLAGDGLGLKKFVAGLATHHGEFASQMKQQIATIVLGRDPQGDEMTSVVDPLISAQHPNVAVQFGLLVFCFNTISAKIGEGAKAPREEDADLQAHIQKNLWRVSYTIDLLEFMQPAVKQLPVPLQKYFYMTIYNAVNVFDLATRLDTEHPALDGWGAAKEKFKYSDTIGQLVDDVGGAEKAIPVLRNLKDRYVSYAMPLGEIIRLMSGQAPKSASWGGMYGSRKSSSRGSTPTMGRKDVGPQALLGAINRLSEDLRENFFKVQSVRESFYKAGSSWGSTTYKVGKPNKQQNKIPEESWEEIYKVVQDNPASVFKSEIARAGFTEGAKDFLDRLMVADNK